MRVYSPILFWALLIGLNGPQAHDAPILLSAHHIQHNEQSQEIHAWGDVQASDGTDVMVADDVQYDQKNAHVTAEGNISVFHKGGDVLNAHKLSMSKDLSAGTLEDIYIYQKDNARLAGKTAIKEGPITILNQAVYSPCALCKADPYAPPTWQIKASDVMRDEENQDIYYSNARLEFLGTPIFYFPFLSHADFGVDRRSGVMPFKFGFDSSYGLMFGIPYYQVVNTSNDFTVLPIITTEGGIFLQNEVRSRFGYGEVKGVLGIGYTDNKNFGFESRQDFEKRFWGHAFVKGNINFTQNWRMLFDIQKVEDRDYLKRYKFLDPGTFGTEPFLNTNIAVEGFLGQHYLRAETFWLQDLRASANYMLTPLVLPKLTYGYRSLPSTSGSYWTFEATEMFLERRASAFEHVSTRGRLFAKPQQVNRLHGKIMWTQPINTNDGSRFKLDLIAQSTLYSYWDYQISQDVKLGAGSRATYVPQAVLSWRKPYVTSLFEGSWYVTPEASLVVGPNQLNHYWVPVEDGQDFEFAEGNIFRPSRLPGVDLIDDGQRLNYGIKSTFFAGGEARFTGFIGQSYAFSKLDAFLNGERKGLYDKGFSDYLAYVEARPSQYVDFSGNFMLSRNRLSPKRAQISANFGPSGFKIKTIYTYVSDSYFAQENEDLQRNQLLLGVQMKLDDNLSLTSTMTTNVGKDAALQNYDVKFLYQNDCFQLGVTFRRAYFKELYARPNDTILLSFSFKNLGTYQTGALGGSTPNRSNPIAF